MGLQHLPPEMRSYLDALVNACRIVFGDRLRCIILGGSLVKGDYIRGYSDLDLHAFVDPDVLIAERTPNLECAIRFQQAIGKLDPQEAGVSQFQVYFLRADRTAEDWSPPVPGSYEVVYGTPPPAVLASETHDYVGQAWRNLDRLPSDRAQLIRKALDKPDANLAVYARLAGTFVKGHAYAAAIAASRDPERVLVLPTSDLLSYLEAIDPRFSAIRAYYELAADWARVQADPDRSREAFRRAVNALEAIEEWATDARPPSE